MENRSRSYILILSAAAMAVGAVGSGCKRARLTTGSDAALSANPAAQLAHSAGQSVSPAELAQQELKTGLQHEALSKSAATNAAPSTATAQASQSQVTQVAEQSKPKPVGPSCYIETFHHQSTPNDTDEESSSHHKNLMVLAHGEINPAHICVRVNGIPVKFSHAAHRKGDQILIGAIAGPSSKITVSYCVGKLECPEVSQKDCTIPRDAFMDALGADSDDDSGAQPAQWGAANAAANAADAKLNADVKKELSDIDGMNGGMGANDGSARGPASMPVFKGWIEDQDTPACRQQTS